MQEQKQGYSSGLREKGGIPFSGLLASNSSKGNQDTGGEIRLQFLIEERRKLILFLVSWLPNR